MPDALVGATDIGVGYFPTYRLFVIGVTAVSAGRCCGCSWNGRITA